MVITIKNLKTIIICFLIITCTVTYIAKANKSSSFFEDPLNLIIDNLAYTNQNKKSFNKDIGVIYEFKNHLYLGTLNIRKGGELWRSADGENWEQIAGKKGVIPNGFGDPRNIGIWCSHEFKDYLYIGTVNIPFGCEIWRSSDGVNWDSVVGGDSSIPNGFQCKEGKTNYYAWYMEEFKDRLYVGVFNFFYGAQLWSTADGVNWDMNVGGTGGNHPANGFGDRDNYGVRILRVFNNELYLGTATRPFRPNKGCEMWKTPNGQNWTRVNIDGFGDKNNKYAWSIEIFNQSLYIGTSNMVDGCQLWKTPDGCNWYIIFDQGINDRNNFGIRAMAVYNDEFYASLGNIKTGCEIWKTNDIINWIQTNQDGFGDKNNLMVKRLTNFKGKLYAGVFNLNGCSLWRYNGTSWTKINIPFKTCRINSKAVKQTSSNTFIIDSSSKHFSNLQNTNPIIKRIYQLMISVKQK